MQYVAVNVIRRQMFQRTGYRLRNLYGKAGLRVIGQSVILSRPVSEFRLQKKIGSRHHSRAISRRQPLSHSSFEVMPPLVSRVDAPKSHAQREFHQAGVRPSFHAVP